MKQAKWSKDEFLEKAACDKKEKQLLKLLEISKLFILSSENELSYQTITDEMLALSGAKYAAFNLFDESGNEFSTVGLAGLANHINKAVELIGYDIKGKKWKNDPNKNQKNKNQDVTVYQCLNELTGDVIARPIILAIEKAFNLGQVAIVRIMKDEVILGDFTLFMTKEAQMASAEILKIFATQLGLYLDKRKLENKLQIIQARLQLAMDAGEHGFWDWDLISDEIYISPSCYQMLGYQSSELPIQKEKWLSLIHPDDVHLVLPKFTGPIHSAGTFEAEYRLKCQNGSWKWVSGKGKAIAYNALSFSRLVGVQVDISKIKHSEHALFESERNFRNFFETIDDLIFISNKQAEIQVTNKAAYQKLGYSAAEIITKNIIDLHPKDKREEAKQILGRMLAGNMETCPLPLVKADGTNLPVETRIWFDKWNGEECIFCISKDLTQEQESLQKFNKLFDSNPSIMAVSKLPDQLLSDVNATFIQTLGYSKEEVLGKSTLELGIFCEPEKQQAIAKELFKKGRIKNAELKLKTKDGQILDGLFTGETIQSQGNEYFLTVMLDITEKKEAEKTRNEQEHYLRTILETTQDGFWVVDENKQIIDANDAYCMMTGYTKEEIIKMKITDLEAMENPEETAARFNRIIEKGCEIFETKIRKTDGSVFDAEISVTCMSKNPVKMICFSRDITQRKIDQEELLHSHSLMRYIIEHNRSAVAIHDKNMNYMYVSRNYLDSYGIKDVDVIGKHHYEIFPDLPQKWKDVHQRALNGEILSAEEDPYERADGSIDWTRWECRAWRERDGSIGGIIVYTEVINERKRMEQMILDEKEHFRTTLLSVGDGVISTDKNGKITVMNKVAEKLTGWSIEDAHGQPSESVFNIIHEQSGQRCENPVSQVLETGEIIELTNHTMLISRQGQEIPIEDSVAPIKNAAGEITGAVLVFRDFTEKREKQNQVEYLSYHDQLTGLYNRRFFEEELNRLNTKRNLPLTLIMLDVNGLKLTNDAFGHLVGDNLLTKTAEILKSICREDEIISRIGGDEFVILLPKTNELQTLNLIKRYNVAFANEKVEGMQISVSSGWATKKDENDSIIHIFKIAEDQMYRDKISDRSSQRYEAIQMIMKTLLEKTPRESQHSKRVCEICSQIGKTLGLDQNKINELETTAELHDIGKIAISDQILNKCGALNDSEWFEIKRHPEVGFNILSSVNAFAPLADIVLAHHERWDGKGYPNQIAGEAIPLNARIISIADSYDAMTEDRPYRKAMDEKTARAEIERCSGTQFDPAIVEIFMNNCSRLAFSDCE